MLQDLSYGRLENEFYIEEPTEDARVLCVQGNAILAGETSTGELYLPCYRDVCCWAQIWKPWKGERFPLCVPDAGNRLFPVDG